MQYFYTVHFLCIPNNNNKNYGFNYNILQNIRCSEESLLISH